MEVEITLEELTDLPEGAYRLFDVRDDVSHRYGTISDSVSMPDVLGVAERGELPRDKTVVLFCMHGQQSLPLAEGLRDTGYDVRNLRGGYGAWLRECIRPADRSAEIEASLRRRCFRERLFSRFARTVVRYELVQPNDRIAVCISGGKDSVLMAKLFQELQRCRKFPFELVFLVMDPGCNELNRTVIENDVAAMGVPITVFETRIFDAVERIEKIPLYQKREMKKY